MRLFFVGMDLIKTAKDYTQKIENGVISYELRKYTGGKSLVVHIREEMVLKDRKLFLISTFESKA
jgi:hypothetical protein